jgi:polyhydroxyalkanoate synthesis repressor PhaR
MRIVKKYANRKLYDTTDKKYVAMDTVARLIKDGEEVTVIENHTGRNITAVVVSQILAREKTEIAPEISSGVLIHLLRKGGERVKDYSDYAKKWIGKSIDKSITEVLGKMNLATRHQIQKLDERIDLLMEKVDHIERLQERKGTKPVAETEQLGGVVPPKETA